jgi:hypothetical protein
LCEDRSKLEIEYNNLVYNINKIYEYSKNKNQDMINEKSRTIEIIQRELNDCQQELSYSQNIIKEMTIERNDMILFLEKYRLGPVNSEE